MDLEVRLLGRLEELKKVIDDILELQEKVASNQSKIARLPEVIDQQCTEKLELRHQVRLLERDLKRCEADV